MNLILILELKNAAIEIKLSLDVFNSMLSRYKKVSVNLVIRPLKFSSVKTEKKKQKLNWPMENNLIYQHMHYVNPQREESKR